MFNLRLHHWHFGQDAKEEKIMQITKMAKLKTAYWRAESHDANVYAYYPVGTLVSVICRGKGNGLIVKLPDNEFDPDKFSSWKGQTKELKFIK